MTKAKMGAAPPDLTARASHFDFGKNWAEYAALINDERLDAATKSVDRLVPDIEGKTFLDIGCGSGLFSAAALRLGARRLQAVDIDEDSVATTRRVLESFGEPDRWSVERISVFDLSPDKLGRFEVVYSWGVLHHTGDMWRAIECAANMVASGGIFAFALYEKTPLCGAWRAEKRAYMRAGPRMKKLARELYTFLFKLARSASGRPSSKEDMSRGMHYEHDLHDWLGGYPYESTTKHEVLVHMSTIGFEPVQERPVKVHAAGLFGTGCSEYVYKRTSGGGRT